MRTEEELLEDGREIVRRIREVADLSRQANAQQDESQKRKILDGISAARKTLMEICSR